MKKSFRILSFLVVFSLLGFSLLTIASAESEKKDTTIVTKTLVEGSTFGICPTEINVEGGGVRQVLFVENLRMASAEVVEVSASRLGSIAAATEPGEYPHDLKYQFWVEGGSEPVGVGQENHPFFEGGSQYSSIVQLNRVLSEEEQQKLYVVLSVDGKPECQRTLFGNYPGTIYCDGVLERKRIKDVVLRIDKEEVGQYYFYPYTLRITVRNTAGQPIAPPMLVTPWFNNKKFVCRDIILYPDAVVPGERIEMKVEHIRQA